MTQFFRSILEWIYGLVGSYGIAVVLFTILIRCILTPLEVSSRKGMRKMAEIQPKLNALQQKYGKDQAKLQQKQQELMKKEHYNPMSGCLPMLIQFPILFIMFYAMRDVANSNIANQAFTFLKGETPIYERFLWIKNVFMPDNLFKPAAVDANSLLAASAKIWDEVLLKLSSTDLETILANIRAAVPAAADLTQEQILNFTSNAAARTTVNTYLLPALQSMPAYTEALAPVPGWANVRLLIVSVTLYKHFNGLLILPILSGLTQIMMTKLNPAMQTNTATANNGQSNGTNAFMKWFFPLFSVFICLSSNAGFALYWCAINVFSTGQSILINKYLDKKDAQKKAIEGGTVE